MDDNRRRALKIAGTFGLLPIASAAAATRGAAGAPLAPPDLPDAASPAQLRDALAGTAGASLIGTPEGTVTEAVANRERVLSITAPSAGGVGDAIPGGLPNARGTDDSAALEKQILALREHWTRIFEVSSTVNRAISGPPLYLEPGRFYLVTRDMPPLPPGCGVRGRGAVVVIGANNIRVFWTDGGAQHFPRPGGRPGVAADLGHGYGTENGDWELPEIQANGHAGTFIVLDTVQRMKLGSLNVSNATGSSYKMSGAVTQGSRFVGLAPADYVLVKKGDVIDLGTVDAHGNPWPYLVVDKRVQVPGAGDRSHAKLKLDQPVRSATGTCVIRQLTFPVVCMKLQQTEMARLTFQACDWTMYLGRNADEGVTPIHDWYAETVTDAYGCNDLEIHELAHDYCGYGVVFGPWTVDLTLHRASLQYNMSGSHLFVNCLDLHIGRIRFEYTVGRDVLNACPCIAVAANAKLTCDSIRLNHNGVGRYLLNQGKDAFVAIGEWETIGGNMPRMPDGRFAPFVKPTIFGSLSVGSAIGMNGPVVDGLNYPENPQAWATDGKSKLAPSGYSGWQEKYQNQVRVGDYTTLTENQESTNRVRRRGEAHDRFYVRGDGPVFIGDGTAPPVQVVGPRQSGFVAMTGTADKTAIATYAAPAISNPPTQAEVQAIATALAAAMARLKAYDDAFFAFGMLGA